MRYCLDCKKKASFNTEGLKAIYCVDHKKEDMVNVVSKTCLDCKKQPTFNTEGLKALYCIDHKKQGMIDVHNKRCLECNTRSYFGLEGHKALYCSAHKKQGMIDVKHKRCLECDAIPTFGFEGQKAVYCNSHKKDGMVDVMNKRCSIHMCDARACKNKDSKSYCIRCYANTFPLEPASKRFKSKELHVKEYLQNLHLQDNSNEEFKIAHDTRIEGGCSKRRPDFLIRLPMFNLIVEVDEFKHEGYDSTCEVARINNIYEDLGMMPLVMIRFNPDGFSTNGNRFKSCFADGKVRSKTSVTHKYEDISYRLEVLSKTIKG